VRSYVRREGRLTPAQARALETLAEGYRLPEVPEALSAEALFGAPRPLLLEIGFGNGETLARMALEAPETGFIGAEVHRPGIGHLYRLLDREGIANVRVYEGDAVDLLQHRIAPGTLAGVRIYFPDPWPKKRHHKRRLVQPAFAALVADRLQPGGLLHFATDCEDYAQSAEAAVAAVPHLQPAAGDTPHVRRPTWRPTSRFERRGRDLGHPVFDLIWRRV